MLAPAPGHPSAALLSALAVFQERAGDVFQIRLPGFDMVVLTGADAGRDLYVAQRHQFSWRTESDAVTQLLRRGILVVDGAEHDRLRGLMEPPLRQHALPAYIPAIIRHTDRVTSAWQHGARYDMLVEMRRVALLILVETLFGVDITAELDKIWRPVLAAIAYISPGAWLLWPSRLGAMPRPRYRRPLATLDAFLLRLIHERRQRGDNGDDLLGRLVAAGDLDDDTIRDQLLTMLIAGHDTSTALLAWSLWLLGSHPEIMRQAQSEVNALLGEASPTATHIHQLSYLDQIVRETLRLYPPIHASQRRTVGDDLAIGGYHIPQGSRVFYSISSHSTPDPILAGPAYIPTTAIC